MLSRSFRVAIAALVVSLAVPLAACAEPTRIPDAEPSSDVTPLFASDEEALAAATAAYEEYLVASNAVTASPDLNLDPIAGLVTESFLENERAALAQFESNGIRSQGESLLVSTALQQSFQEEDGQTVVVFYACVDVAGVRLLDANGSDVTPPERPPLVALEVEVLAQEEDKTRLLVSKSALWEDPAACN